MDKPSKKTKIKSSLLAFVGLLLMPLVISIYFIDRVILVVLPHIKAPTLGDIFRDFKIIGQSILRVVTVTIIYFLIMLIF